VKLLLLGGPRFLGRAITDAALERGHDLTFFNRGTTNPELYPEVERLVGDRTSDLSALAGRDWDAVVDTCGYLPRDVTASVEALAGAVTYCFVSSVSVYADQSVPPTEGSPVATLGDLPSDEVTDESYGALKALCEAEVRETFADRALIVRPGLIVGPYDPTGRFSYWPHRVARGGEVLAPGRPDDSLQFVDVGDLADWIVRSTENELAGTFNATGHTMPFHTLLDECQHVTGSDASFTWVASDWLLAAGVEEWMGIPLWIASPGWEAANRVAIDRAVAAGLGFRPLEDTVRATVAHASTVDGVGPSPEREATLLAQWHGRE
jgi:nucleoside-diphosphate-sugar epimerase